MSLGDGTVFCFAFLNKSFLFCFLVCSNDHMNVGAQEAGGIRSCGSWSYWWLSGA